MKKILVLLLTILFITGCSGKLTERDLNRSINEVKRVISSKQPHSNAYAIGFKYYKPRDFSVLEDKGFNQTLLHNSNKYYLNVDVNAYYYKFKSNFEKESDDYYSSSFQNEGIEGYVRIKKTNNDYFYIKMMYNYSYVEVSVTENEIYDAIIDSSIILSSIKYNDKIISTYMGNAVSSSLESKYEVKKPKQEKTERQNVLDYYEGNNQN